MDADLFAVAFANANTGTAVGRGAILRTTDGGATWTSQSTGTTYWLWGISIIDVNTETVVGDWGTILRTTNGGDSWTTQTSGMTHHLNGISFTNANGGTVVGTVGTILHTTNAGGKLDDPE
jgi:photosystem II stability/assembly factor-like uncharacterized protein